MDNIIAQTEIGMLIRNFDERLKRRRAEPGRPPQFMAQPQQQLIQALAAMSASQRLKGTTIVGIVCKDAVVMAGDRLVTAYDQAVARNYTKLENIETNAVLGFCGLVSFAQMVSRNLQEECEALSSRIKRPVSFPGKCNILRQIIGECVYDFLSLGFFDISFGGILGGFDAFDGPVLSSFNDDGCVIDHKYFVSDGSGRWSANPVLKAGYRPDLERSEAVVLAIAAIRMAGEMVTSVSHPMDPPPTVRVISAKGIIDVDEEIIFDECEKLDKLEWKFFFGKKKTKKVKKAPKPAAESKGEPQGDGS